MKRLALLSSIAVATAGLLAALAPGAQAQEPRKGGVVRMTAPYASSFGNLDPHMSGRSQDGQLLITPHERAGTGPVHECMMAPPRAVRAGAGP